MPSWALAATPGGALRQNVTSVTPHTEKSRVPGQD